MNIEKKGLIFLSCLFLLLVSCAQAGSSEKSSVNQSASNLGSYLAPGVSSNMSLSSDKSRASENVTSNAKSTVSSVEKPSSALNSSSQKLISTEPHIVYMFDTVDQLKSFMAQTDLDAILKNYLANKGQFHMLTISKCYYIPKFSLNQATITYIELQRSSDLSFSFTLPKQNKWGGISIMTKKDALIAGNDIIGCIRKNNLRSVYKWETFTSKGRTMAISNGNEIAMSVGGYLALIRMSTKDEDPPLVETDLGKITLYDETIKDLIDYVSFEKMVIK